VNRFCRALAIPALALLLGAAVPEPDGYYLGPPNGPVPATLSGARVIDADHLAALITEAAPVLVDVANAPRRPPGQPPGSPWLPLPHHDIPGSLWIPGAGNGAVSPAEEAFLQHRLAQATAGDRRRPVVFYCHARCWLSWNAAKRAVAAGYRQVYWFPGGIEAWQQSGRHTAPARPEGPGAG